MCNHLSVQHKYHKHTTTITAPWLDVSHGYRVDTMVTVWILWLPCDNYGDLPCFLCLLMLQQQMTQNIRQMKRIMPAMMEAAIIAASSLFSKVDAWVSGRKELTVALRPGLK